MPPPPPQLLSEDKLPYDADCLPHSAEHVLRTLLLGTLWLAHEPSASYITSQIQGVLGCETFETCQHAAQCESFETEYDFETEPVALFVLGTCQIEESQISRNA